MTKYAHETDLRFELITPERAAFILSLNTGNRNVRLAAVASYARDMAAGNWKRNGIPIIMNGDRLLDGQHRLLACVKAGVAFETAVMRNADEEIHFTIDRGMKRTIADELQWSGESNVNSLASTLTLLWKYENESLMNPRMAPTAHEIIGFLNVRPHVRVAIAEAQGVARRIGVPIPALAVALALLSEHGDDIPTLFMAKLRKGEGLAEGDPVLALRNYALNVATVKKNRPRREEWLALIIKAANAWLLGRSVNTLRWRRYGPAAEPFPRLLSPDDVQEA